MSYIQNITNSTEKILNIIDTLVGIKDIKNISSYYFEATSIREIIEKSIEKYKNELNSKNITFKVSSFQNIPLLSVDLKKISFVINSVIENSIKYTNKDGKIFIDCISDENKLTFFLSDNGIGLTIVDKIRIFSKFYRNKRALLMNTDGVGLSLYISRKIIKRHSGEIYAKSKGKNKGSTFFIEIPFSK
jgi:signal transduction histidine kinase